MNNTPKLEKMSRLINAFLVTIGIIIIGIALFRWFLIDNPNFLPPTVAAFITEPLTLKYRFTGFLIELIPLSAALITLKTLHLICTAYSRGEVFSQGLVKMYRRFGRALMMLAIANGLYTALLSAVFSWFRENKKIVLSLGLSTADLYLLMLGLVFVMLGTVMEEAYRIHEENKQIV